MARPDEQAPFPREPWQRLLEDPTDGPPETTDARIRAAARRDLAPRGRRWWLPASLAASFVLAVMIVHSEFGTIRRAPMTESEATGNAAINARIIERGAGPEAREVGKSPSAAARRAAPAQKQAEADEYGDLDAETGSEEAGVGPRVGGPEHELRAASELPDEAAASADDSFAPAAAAPQPSASAGFEAEPAEPVPPSPEAWYAAIQKLIEQGRLAEAESELEALRKAYPDWAAAHLKPEERR